MFWLCVMTAEAFTAWAAGLTNCKGSNAQVKIKPSSLEARRETEFGTCCRYLEGSSAPKAESNGWRKEGMVDIYSRICQSLWIRSSADLTWGAAFTSGKLF